MYPRVLKKLENDALVEALPLPLDGGFITKGQKVACLCDDMRECKEEEMVCETAEPSQNSGRRILC